MAEDRRHIASHAALRGVAAVLVVAYHLQYGGPHLAVEDATAFFRRSYLFVDLFFVLSGFIIAFVNDADRATPMRASEAGRFLLRRLIRLYPLHLFCLGYLLLFVLLSSAVLHAAGKPWAVAWTGGGAGLLGAQLLLVNAWLPNPDGWNVPSWSISAELFAYLLFPLIVAGAARARAPTIAAGLLAAIGFYGVIAARTGSLDIIGGLAPLRCLAGFLLGMGLFFAREWIAARPVALLSLVQVAAVAAIGLVLALPVNDVAAIPGFALLVGSTWTDRGLLPWLLARRPLLWLGDLSYSIYLNHVCIIDIVGFLWVRLLRHLPPMPVIDRLAWIGITYAAVLLVSRFTFRHVEVPARRWLSERLMGRRPRPIADSVPAP